MTLAQLAFYVVVMIIGIIALMGLAEALVEILTPLSEAMAR